MNYWNTEAYRTSPLTTCFFLATLKQIDPMLWSSLIAIDHIRHQNVVRT